ncbi:hypothetical protein [Aureibacter tunicatorum]|uniref:REP element-mobilizing transposase RayT n=1 Tax=Aureibacter tunicatorum TaxID=866807 RepID=A0AAE3XRA4_9BACT|nr:hypothetical protein [Aureibacter tunicatorum]MDR6240480.1 REP element-mobilizing transposase RayT [Aureibacter tunicatorum]BDD06657.1 hypothetical protein AUTU_41400 [Aureibacter tunicatorum]
MYHIYTHAIGSEDLFRNDHNYQFFLTKYKKYIPLIGKTYAYCLLPSHLHILIQFHSEDMIRKNVAKQSKLLSQKEKVEEIIYRQIGNLFNSYTQSYNKYFHRRGSLFIEGFKRKSIDNMNYFLNVLKYIHQNPVNHNFVLDSINWRYSSVKEYLLEKEIITSQKWMNERLENLDKASLYTTNSSVIIKFDN